ncbi:SusC/RagA family TonB-linked outer membrane protein [Bacteroidia bacterium]|nr:SusC/RagA family TonB-linked outer membrane protein [Bacteroidia bacterium]
MQAFASDNSKETLSISMKNVSIEQVLNEIESQSDYRFLYNKRLIDVDRKVNISINSENVSDVLKNLFNTEEVKFTISDHQIVLSRNERPVTTPQQQGRTVTGVVVDEAGELLVGVNITVKGQSTIGTITDMDGKFSLGIPAGNVTLIFSYIGYSSQEVAASTREMRVVLSEDALNLDELVVIGYGVVKKSDVTGSVVSVNSEEMMKRNPTTVALGLQGAAAGVYVGRSGGPDGGTSVRIRGVATINNSTDPLYVVDGIRVGGNIDYLNPNDVISIEILKDASATAIYGSEGANGVVMITTRKGERGRTRLNFSANYGLQTNSKKIDVLDAEGFVKATRIAAANDNSPLNAVWANYDKELNSIDWQDEMSRKALQQVYNLSVMGGSESTQSVLSFGYMNNEGIIINSNFRRLNVRGNIDHTIKKFLRIGLSTTYMYNEMYSGGGSRGNSFSGLFNDNGLLYYALLPPTMDDVDENGKLVHTPIQYPNGEWGHFPLNTTDINKDADNPVAATTQSVEAKNKMYGSRIITNAYVEVDLYKGLMFRTTGGFNYGGNSRSNYTPLINRTRTLRYSVEDALSISSGSNTQLSLESYITYNFDLAKIHRISVMAGHSLSRSFSLNTNLSSNALPVPSIRRIELSQRSSSITGTGGLGLELRTQSFFGRANYSLLDRYLLTATVRRDGSSNFGAGNRYGTFPSASLAWRASEESFIKKLNVFSNLKLRLGWGQTGNAGMPTNRSVDQMSSSNIHYYYYNGSDFVLAPGLAQTVLIDTNLKWETNEQKNLGLDFGFVNNRYSFSVDYFVRDAKDLLLQRNVRTSLGYNNVYTNAGHIQNKGLEFMGSYQTGAKDWTFNARVNAAMLKNKVIDIGDPLRSDFGYGDNWDNASITTDGYPIASFYAFRVDGIFQSQTEIDEWNAKSPLGYYQVSAVPGDFRYKDLNGNGYLDDNDREIIGNGFSNLDYGLNLSATYKQWDASLYAYGVAGKKVMSLGYAYLNNIRHSEEGYRNILKEAVGRAWTPENHSNEYARLSIRDNNLNGRISDAFLKSADFFRLQNVQIGYSLNKNQLKFANLDNLRIFGSVENIFTFTNYVGNLEPEGGAGNAGINNNNAILLNGFDNGHYPLQRTFTIGLTVGF